MEISSLANELHLDSIVYQSSYPTKTAFYTDSKSLSKTLQIQEF